MISGSHGDGILTMSHGNEHMALLGVGAYSLRVAQVLKEEEGWEKFNSFIAHRNRPPFIIMQHFFFLSAHNSLSFLQHNVGLVMKTSYHELV